MPKRPLYWPTPFKTQIAIAGLNRLSSHRRRRKARPMHIELLSAYTINETFTSRNNLCVEYILIPSIGISPIADMNDTVIEADHLTSSGSATRPMIAVAAATAGEARYTFASLSPMRPMKLRLLVLTQTSPGASTP